MSVDLLPEALALAVVGMATVFGLLAVLIAAIAVMSRLIHPRPRPAQPAETPEGADAQAEMAAAVAAAIRHHHHHRARATAGAATGP